MASINKMVRILKMGKITAQPAWFAAFVANLLPLLGLKGSQGN
jgi:hypothetical protein